jgi:hypothetical protein
MDIEVKEKARAEKPKAEPKAKAEKPKEQEYVPMIKSGVTRIYHKSLVGKMTGEGWKVK